MALPSGDRLDETSGDRPDRDLKDPLEHTLLEDFYALVTGCGLLAIGLVLMKEAGIVTAGVAGIALLLGLRKLCQPKAAFSGRELGCRMQRAFRKALRQRFVDGCRFGDFVLLEQRLALTH